MKAIVVLQGVLGVILIGTTFSVNAQVNTFPNSGNVGIGTGSPQTGLQLGDRGTQVYEKQISIPGVYNFETIKLGQLGNGNGALEFVNHSGINASYGVRLMTNIDNGGPGFYMQYATPQFSYDQLNYTTGLFLGINGNVGIGTTAPADQLSVRGNIVKQTTVGVDGVWDNVVKYGYFGDLESGSSFANRWHGVDATITAGAASNNKMKFKLYGGGGANLLPIDVMTLQGDGNVGIGTTTPNERLAVNGNIRAREIKVETANWPDYVFQPDYELKPLSEVATFIKENGHLPEVPKAAVVEADGVSLGEMNRILLKKVEELTLYLIENQEKRTSLEKQVLELKQLIIKTRKK